MEPGKPSQKIDYVSVAEGSLAGLLKLPEPILVDVRDEPHRQLNYIDQYARTLGCKTFLIEHHYIDRDYMEEHSIFYSKDLSSSVNYCRRVHFFRCPQKDLQAEVSRLYQLALGQTRLFEQACRDFSEQNYIGFSVIKPLLGCPVGRTVLACYPEETGKGTSDGSRVPAITTYTF